MKKAPVILFVSLLIFAAAPYSSQKAEAPSFTAAAQDKKQDQRPQFTHAEVAQFVRTVQTEAANWKDTINSVDPSALHLGHQTVALIEKEKKTSLLALDEIRTLSLPTSEKNAATDLFVEFGVYTFLGDTAHGAESLSETLSYNWMRGGAKAGELLQVSKEAKNAETVLFKEILTRIANIAKSEKADGCQ